MVQKDEVSKFFCSEVRSREIFPVSVLRNCRTGMSSPLVDKGHNFYKSIQVSRSLLELCGRHAMMFQVKVPQVALVRQLACDVA